MKKKVADGCAPKARTTRRKTRTTNKLITAAVITGLLATFLWSPFSNYGISLAVMKTYSRIHRSQSIMAAKGIELEIPGGGVTLEDDWYPFVMTFNATSGFRRFSGESDVDLTILYNFPSFDKVRGCSRLFDPSSPYYNGFYGAYLVTRGERENWENEGGLGDSEGSAVNEGDASELPYGFLADGSMDIDRVAEVPRFDFQRLVLRDFGLKPNEMVFKWELESVSEGLTYAGSDGWTRVDANLLVNGAAHESQKTIDDRGFVQSYLQYGVPNFEVDSQSDGEDFTPVEMIGRVYGKYFEEWDSSVFFYVMACDEDVLESCDSKILSKSVLK